MAQIHRRCMPNCASTGAGAQILGMQCQKEAEKTSSVEEHWNLRVASVNQTVSVWGRAYVVHSLRNLHQRTLMKSCFLWVK